MGKKSERHAETALEPHTDEEEGGASSFPGTEYFPFPIHDGLGEALSSSTGQ